MNLPSSFHDNIRAVDGEPGILWLLGLEGLLADLASQWGLSSLMLVENLSFNLIVTARSDKFDERVVLKVSPPNRSVWNEVRWLKHYRNAGPDVLDFDSLLNAFLMRRCHDGESLKNELPKIGDERATRILCGAIRRLRSSSVKDESFRHLSDLIPDFDILEHFTEKRLFAKSQDLFRDLTRDRSRDVLLHGDLHHDNLIRSGEEWLVIDPHGYQGPPTAEVGVMIYNPLDAFPNERPLEAVLDRRIRILAEELGDDIRLIQDWCFCKAMLSAAWNAKDFPEQARREIEIARLIEKLEF